MNDKTPTILIVEDDIGLQNQLKWHFEKYHVVIAGDRQKALDAMRQYEPGVVLQDLGLPPDDTGVSEGFRTLQEILKLAPHTKVIVITGFGDRNNALKAVELGAYDFYEKPLETSTLDLIVERAQHIYSLEQQNRTFQSHSQSPFDNMVAGDEVMLAICRRLNKIAPTDVSVLLTGESGTGKQLIAQNIHNHSPRQQQPFLAVSCSAVSESILETDLFGRKNAAFDYSSKQQIGKLEQVQNGTLFIDDIDAMSHNLQTKLLQFLRKQNADANKPLRLVCASQSPLIQAVEKGRFQQELYYSLSEVSINIPSLRERPNDKVLLARHFLNQYNREFNLSLKGFSQDALNTIDGYEWPGNINELKNRIKGAAIIAEDKWVSSENLHLDVEQPSLPINLRQVRSQAERQAINKALTMSNNNISKAAKLLGITRPTLYDLMKKYDIQQV